MTNLTRVTGKTFGETATATGDDPEIGQFGSAKAGTYVGTTDIATIQSLPAWSNGFVDSVTPNTQFPPLPEVTGALKVLSHQENYILQKGVAEWDSGTTYYTGDICKGVGVGILYESLAENNTGNALTDTTKWQKLNSGANIDLSNLSSTGQGVIDGQWVLVDTQLSTSAAVGTYDIDLSSILPNDSYQYEIALNGIAYSSSSTYSVVRVKGAGTAWIDIVDVGSNGRTGVVSQNVVIGTSRVLQLWVARNAVTWETYNETGKQGLYMVGYRRLGSNS